MKDDTRTATVLATIKITGKIKVGAPVSASEKDLAFNIAGVAAKKIGGRVLNGVVERHLGMDDVDVAGAMGMAGGALLPVVKEAYSEQEGDSFLTKWGRRTKWTLGIIGVASLVGGAGYLGWKYLGKKAEPEEEE